jgi:hypothetical protein
MVRVHEQILRLDVAVNDAIAMTPFNGKAQLKYVSSHHVSWQTCGMLLQNFEKIPFDVLKHEKQLALAPKRLQQRYNVAMPQEAEDLYLTQRSLTNNLVFCSHKAKCTHSRQTRSPSVHSHSRVPLTFALFESLYGDELVRFLHKRRCHQPPFSISAHQILVNIPCCST